MRVESVLINGLGDVSRAAPFSITPASVSESMDCLNSTLFVTVIGIDPAALQAANLPLFAKVRS
jgi:hypothetical protein